MIPKTILTLLLLMILYTVFVVKFAPDWWVASQSHWQRNLSKAQNFSYDEGSEIQSVIVGSSLAESIQTDSLPYTYNLSFAGRNAIDGLIILDKKAKIARNIFIEINNIDRKSTHEFTDLIDNPVMYYPRKFFLSLREDKQPIAILGLIQLNELNRIKKRIPGKTKHVDPPDGSEMKDAQNPLFPQLLKMSIDNYSQVPGDSDFKITLSELRHYISRLEKRGANIVFFEMPVDKQLEGLPRAKFMRNIIKTHFSSPKYTFIPLPDSMAFQTSDGIHLRKKEALEYTMFFKSKNKNIWIR